MCCNLPQKCTLVKLKESQKVEYQFVKSQARYFCSSSSSVLFYLGQTRKPYSQNEKEKCLRHNVHIKAITGMCL